MAYRNYEPTRTKPGDSYNAFLDELGFRAGAMDYRKDFINDLTTHVDSSTFRYVRQRNNPLEFRKMIFDFLTKHGNKYWGLTKRDHLSERDSNQGFLCPRDATRLSSRLIMVLESMFNYKAKSLCKQDAKKDPDKRVLSSINEGTMIWPPRDNVITELRKSKRRRIEIQREATYDSDEPLRKVLERARNPGFQYTVAESSWRPTASHRGIQYPDTSEDEGPIVPHKKKRGPKTIVTDEEEDDSTIALQESMRASSITPAQTAPYYDADTAQAHEVPQVAVTNREITNVFERSLRATKRSGSAQTTHHNPRVESKVRDNSLGTSDQSNVAQFTRPNPQVVENQGGDDEIIILEGEPSTWQKYNKVKQEIVTVKQEQLAVEVTYGIRLVVSASNQPGMAPVNIPLGSVPSIETLFNKLAKACQLRFNEAKKIAAVSVLYTWTGERQRLRKGESEDWEYFNNVLAKEYERNPTRFEEGCHVDMMVHVDG